MQLSISLCYLQRCAFYNSTALSPKEQVHNAIIIEHFKPPLASMPHARILVCSTFYLYVFLRIAKFNHAATLPHEKIILYSPFSHKQYSMAIHTELHKTAISVLVINIVFSCLSLCRRHQHFLCPSTHRHLQHTISSLQSHCLYYV